MTFPPIFLFNVSLAGAALGAFFMATGNADWATPPLTCLNLVAAVFWWGRGR